MPGATCSNRVAGKGGSVSLHEVVTLRAPGDFRRVLKEGKRIPIGGIVLVGATGPEGPPRVGLTVSREVGNAVTRNRARRRLRHTLRDLQLQPNMDYVIIARKSMHEAPYATLVGWLRRAVDELADG